MRTDQMEAVIRQHYEDILRYMIYRFRDRHLVEDLTQETFFRFIRYGGELTFPTQQKCKAYLFQTASNVCRDYFAHRTDNVELEETVAAPEENRDLSIVLETVLGKLPDIHREAAVLYYYHGFRVREIAEIQNVTVSAVKSRLKQARDTLRKLLKEEELL